MNAEPTTVSATTDELFTAAYAEYRGMVHRTIVHKLGRPDYDLADDLTQDTFLKLFRYRERIEFGPRIAGLLKLMAKQSVGHHYAVMRNTRETPTDTDHWSYANRALVPAVGGTLKPLASTHPGDSDPDPDEALRRVRQGRQMAGAR